MDNKKKKKDVVQQASDFARALGFTAVPDLAGGIQEAGTATGNVIRKAMGKDAITRQNSFVDEDRKKQIAQNPVKEAAKSAAGLASWMIPVGKGATAAKTAVKFIASEGARGALSSTAQEQNPVTGAVGSIAAGGALKAVGAGGNQVARTTMNNLFREPTKRAVTAAIKKGDELGAKVAAAKDLGKGMTEDQIYQGSLKKLEELEDSLQDTLKNAKAKISLAGITDKLQPRIDDLINAGETEAASTIVNRLSTWQKMYGDEIPATLANKIKRTLYDKINKSYGAQGAEGVENVKAVAKAIKESIAERVPGVSEVNQKLSDNGRIAESMVSRMAKSNNPNLMDAATAGVGFMATGMNPVGALAAPMVKRALDSVPGQKAQAAVGNGVSAIANNPIIQKLAGMGGAVGGNAIQDLSSEQPVISNAHDNTNQNTDQNGFPHESIVTADQLNNNPQPQEELITIINDETGEEKQIRKTELSQYGINEETSAASQPEKVLTKEKLEEMYAMAIASGTKEGRSWATEIRGAIKDMYPEEEKDKPKKLTEGDKKFALAGQEAEKALSLLDTGITTGKAAAAKSKFSEFFGTQDENTTNFKQQLATARTAARNALLGANMSDKELESYLDAVFSYADEPNILKAKLKGFVTSMQDYRQNIAGGGDIDISQLVTP